MIYKLFPRSLDLDSVMCRSVVDDMKLLGKTKREVLLKFFLNAIKNDAVHVIKLLLDTAIFDPNDPGIHEMMGETILHFAIRNNKPKVVKAIIESKKINIDAVCKPDIHETPLCLAVKLGRNEIAKKLIEKGASINGNDKNYIITPLILAIQSKNQEMESLLRKRRVRLPVMYNSIDTIKKISLKPDELLIDKLTNQFKAFGHPSLPLHMNTRNKMPKEECDYLTNILHGIDVCNNINPENYEYTEARIEHLLRHPKALIFLFGIKISNQFNSLLDLLLSRMDYALIFYHHLCQPDSNGILNYHRLLAENMDDAMLIITNGKETVKKCAFIFIKSLVMAAIKLNHLEFIKIILEDKRFDANHPLYHIDDIGNILHYAASLNQHEVVSLLIKSKKMDINSRSVKSLTPLEMAIKYNCKEAKEVLLENGAKTHGSFPALTRSGNSLFHSNVGSAGDLFFRSNTGSAARQDAASDNIIEKKM